MFIPQNIYGPDQLERYIKVRQTKHFNILKWYITLGVAQSCESKEGAEWEINVTIAGLTRVKSKLNLTNTPRGRAGLSNNLPGSTSAS